MGIQDTNIIQWKGNVISIIFAKCHPVRWSLVRHVGYGIDSDLTADINSN